MLDKRGDVCYTCGVKYHTKEVLHMVEETAKGTKERSAVYPAVALDECVEFVRTVNKLGGRKVASTSIAEALGVSPATYSFRAKVSSSKQFGLIKSTGGAVELCDIAKKILYPTDDLSSKQLLIQCLMTAPLYKKLIEKYNDSAVPTTERLGNILFQEHNITRAAKDNAAKKFITSLEYAGVLQNGVLVLDDCAEGSELEAENEDRNKGQEPATSSGEIASSESKRDNKVVQEGYHFAIPTLSGATAQVTIPKEITVKDLDYILLYIQSMLPAFIENLKDELK